MVKILIIDDEAAAGNILKILISKHIPGVAEINYCDNAKDALELLKTFNLTLVMLDIEMPNMNGFDFLNLLYPPTKEFSFMSHYKYCIARAKIITPGSHSPTISLCWFQKH